MQQRFLPSPNRQSPPGPQHTAHGFFYLRAERGPEILYPWLPRGGLVLCLPVGTLFHQCLRFFPSTSGVVQTTVKVVTLLPEHLRHKWIQSPENLDRSESRKVCFICFLVSLELVGQKLVQALKGIAVKCAVLPGCLSDPHRVSVTDSYSEDWKLLRASGLCWLERSLSRFRETRLWTCNSFCARLTTPLGNCLT